MQVQAFSGAARLLFLINYSDFPEKTGLYYLSEKRPAAHVVCERKQAVAAQGRGGPGWLRGWRVLWAH